MRIGVDTGGTFTDLVLLDGERLVTHKLPSSPPDFHVAVLQGIRELLAKAHPNTAGDPPPPPPVVHSTTVATNALLERKGAPTALITTEGFRDVLAIGRQNRPDLYDLNVTRPPPLVPASLRLEQPARLTADGTRLGVIDPARLQSQIAFLLEQRVQAVAVCYLFSFLDPAQENATADALRAAGFRVCTSAEILPEFREYERTATTVANAYVTPAMDGYLHALQTQLTAPNSPSASPTGPGESANGWQTENEICHPLATPQKPEHPGEPALTIVQSNGGTLPAETAATQPVRTLLSGPAAGVTGAIATAREALNTDHPRLLTFDMGGTSTDVAFIDGQPGIRSDLDLAGVPVRVPMLDLHTVGAGGGSIAWIDAGGALQVGPQSAGALPGPACYGRGGTLPTVTDANLHLDRLDPAAFLDGRMTLDADATRAALKTLADPLGASLDETAEAILRLVNAHMEQAIRVISVQRGHDPRTCVLLSFGGAGGLHAADLANALGIDHVLVPAHPGVLSALGCVVADRLIDHTQTLLCPLDESTFPRLLAAQSAAIDTAREQLTREGFTISRQRFITRLSARYQGQSHEILSPLETTLPSTIAAFHRAHEQRHASHLPDHSIEVVALRLRATGLRKTGPNEAPPASVPTQGPAAMPPVDGPAILHRPYTTIRVPTEFRAAVDGLGHTHLKRKMR